MNRAWTSIAAGLIVACAAGTAFGQGMLVPTDRTLPPLAIKSQQVEIAIDNQVATTTVKQVFANSTARELEASYVFPIPAEAAIRDFAMMVDGKRTSGELVEATQARQIYQSIVAQARDPGLLEHLGDNLFRVRVFPVPANGTQSVELSFSQLVPGSSGVFRYTYPLKTGSKASQVQDFFSVGVKLTSKVPIKSVYSPTHQVGITRRNDHEATVGLELSKAVLDTDFSLYWTVSDKDFGLNAVAYRPDAEQDGYLMLLISPKSAVNAEEVIAKDVQFVFDTSGSMGGEKIEQAKKALAYCVENLNARDRFNIITYATDVTPFKDALVPASKENKEASRDYIARLRAEGGTNIFGALTLAMETARNEKERPQVIVFMTDGRPTIGSIDVNEIVAVVAAAGAGDGPARDDGPARADAIRVFTFGVGNDVNTHLLDRVAGSSGGTTEYVRPGEDIEVKVSDFFAKASHPVMTGLKLAFGGQVKVSEMFPQTLGDLYFGQQVVAFARYRGDGDVAVTLSGAVSTGRTESHTYEVTLPKQTTDNSFIESLWANRKVGYLLDHIRLHGEEKELKDEVIRLSRKYKIQTPYTSYLVLEEQHRRQYLGNRVAGASADGLDRGRTLGRGSGVAPSGPATRQLAPAPPPSPQPTVDGTVRLPARTDAPADIAPGPAESADPDRARLRELFEHSARDGQQGQIRRSEDDGRFAGRPGSAPAGEPADRSGYDRPKDADAGWSYDDLKAESGAGAVNLAKGIAGLKQAEQLAEGKNAISLGKDAAGRTFYPMGGFWVDEKFDAAARLTFVKWGSEAYFAIVTAREDLKDAFALGTRLVLTTAEGKALVISETDGAETLTEQEVEALFTAATPTTQPDSAGG